MQPPRRSLTARGTLRATAAAAVGLLALATGAPAAELANGDLLVSEPGPNELTRIEPTGAQSPFASTGDSPFGLAVLPDRRVVVAVEVGGDTDLQTYAPDGTLLCTDAGAVVANVVRDLDRGADGNLYGVGTGRLWRFVPTEVSTPVPGCLEFARQQVANLGGIEPLHLDVVASAGGGSVDGFRVSTADSRDLLRVETNGAFSETDISLTGIAPRQVIGVASRSADTFWFSEQDPTLGGDCDPDRARLSIFQLPVSTSVAEGAPLRCPGDVAGDGPDRAYVVDTERPNPSALGSHLVRVERASPSDPWVATRLTSSPLVDPLDLELVPEPQAALAAPAALATLAGLAARRRRGA